MLFFLMYLIAVDKYGKIVGFYIGNEPGVILADFDLIKDIYKRDDVSTRPSMRPFCDMRPGHWVLDKENDGKVPGVIFTQGKFWTEQRRFTLRALRDFGFGKASMEDTIMDEVEKLCDQLKPFEGEPIGSAAPKISIKEKFNHLSILQGSQFGITCPAQGYPVPAFR